MLHLLDEGLEAFLRARVPLPERDVDVSFDAPDRDWSARVTRPTVNVFLWDVRRNFEQTDAGHELTTDAGGRPVRRRPPYRVDCRYLVTAWTSDVRDEHSLLGAVLDVLLRSSELEARFLTGALAPVLPLPAVQVAVPGPKDTADFWSALGGQLKPGLDLVITATVPADAWPAGPPIQEYLLRMRGRPEQTAAGGEEELRFGREPAAAADGAGGPGA